jgi:hypothetical protein
LDAIWSYTYITYYIFIKNLKISSNLSPKVRLNKLEGK